MQFYQEILCCQIDTQFNIIEINKKFITKGKDRRTIFKDIFE